MEVTYDKPVLILVVTETDSALEPGPMADQPERFHFLPMDQIAGKLAQL